MYRDRGKRVLLRCDQSNPVSLFPRMYLTRKHILSLLLPGQFSCPICHRSNWNQYGVWCVRGRWLHHLAVHRATDQQVRLKALLLVQDNRSESYRGNFLHSPHILKFFKQNPDKIIDWMQKNNIPRGAYQDIKLNEKSPVKSPACYFIIQENRPK